ncbi:hypothetical protein FRB97_005621 [Tulasnella sp. 331]|nr:hypothetical protein FRB97_005621 [Tulasnella sp. 331]
MFETETVLINGHLQKVFVNSWSTFDAFITVSPEWLVTFWACQLLGAIAVAVNAWLPASDGAKSPLTHCIAHTGCKIIIVDAERASALEHWVAKGQRVTGLLAVLVIRSQDAAEKHRSHSGWIDMQKWEDIMRAYKGKTDVWESEAPCSPEEYFAIFFTSGTTGLPKGVPITHRGWSSNILNTASMSARDALRRGEPLPVPNPDAPQTGTIVVGPMFHVIGLMTSVGTATQIGNKLILLKKWNKDTAVELMKKEGVAGIGGVPSIVSDLLESSLQAAHLPPLFFYMGGAVVGPALMHELMKKFPDATPIQAYGLTETGCYAAGHCGGDFIGRPSSTGLAGLTDEIAIVSTETLKVQKPGVKGEIWIRGSNIMRGYWNDPVASDLALTKDGWLRTGDLGYMDDEGFLYINDRVKDIIIRGGENIDSTMVENAIRNHPIVHDCAAVAVPDDRLGELVAVVISAREENKGQMREEELISEAKKHLPSFAVPVMILELDELPTNAAGKVVKLDLRVMAKAVWEKRRREAKSKL